MPRIFAKVNAGIWGDPDFRALPPAAQHLYLQLWTSPDLSFCGVHDWRPARLTGLSSGFSADHVRSVADCLSARFFVVQDEGTEEILVRSWARFDETLKQPRLAISYVNAYATVASPNLRAVLVHETAKMQKMWPELACWTDARVLEVLSHPAVSARALPTPDDPFGDGFGDGFALGLPQTQGKVWGSVSVPPTTTTTTTTTNKTTTRESDKSDESFEEFWTRYPRKIAKGTARKAWTTAVKKADADQIVNAARSFAARSAGADPKFVPHAATWLNGERWSDETETQQAESAGEWFQPFTPSEAPPEVADDPERYAAWLEDQRAAWRAEGGR